MSHWIYVTSPDNWNVTEKTNILGVSQRFRNMLSQVNKGDKCLVYVKKGKVNGEKLEPRIVGIYEILSQVYEDSSQIFDPPVADKREAFTLRIKLRPVRVLKTALQFKPLVARLSFIKNKERWAMPFMGRGLVQIPREDYEIIVSAAK